MNFKYDIVKLLNKYLLENTAEEIENMLETPPSSDMGDFAFPCFKLAKQFRKSPQAIAEELHSKIEVPEFIEKIEIISGYLNFFINRKLYIETTLKQVFKETTMFGSNTDGKDKTLLLDYSSINVAKHLHIGHIRNTMLGNALKNIYQFSGYSTVSINHLGDYGTNYGNLIFAYKQYSSNELVEKDGVNELLRIYVKFHDEVEKDPFLADEGRKWFVKLEQGDEEAVNAWKWFKEITMKEVLPIYEKLNVKFNDYIGESFYTDKISGVIKQLEEKNLLKDSEGAKIVELENIAPCLILKKDGSSLYATRDLAAAIYRQNAFHFDECIYITGSEQILHFKQFFTVLQMMGFEWAKNLHHIGHGMVNLKSGKISTRSGNFVLANEVLKEATSKTLEIINEKNPILKNKEQVSEDVGIGAVIFNNLYNTKIKDVTFSWEEVLNFEGETGPYVQYTHARACSVLRKGSFDSKNIKLNYDLLKENTVFELSKVLGAFPEKIIESRLKQEPCILSRHLVDICQMFNKFYNESPILVHDEDVKNTRLALVYATKLVLETGLNLICMKAPEEM